MSRTTEAENEAPWQKVLSRWALAYGLYELGALLAFATVVGFDVLGPGAFEAAARNPAIFRIGAGLDLTAWLWIGGTLLVFAGLFARSAPIRAAFLAACSVGQLTGLLGGYTMLVVLGDLGARAAAAPDQYAALAAASGPVLSSMLAHYGAGQLLYGAGYLLIASVALSLSGFPRWVGVWFALYGLYAVANQVAYVATGGLPVPTPWSAWPASWPWCCTAAAGSGWAKACGGDDDACRRRRAIPPAALLAACSLKTVQNHVANSCSKLQVTDRLQAAIPPAKPGWDSPSLQAWRRRGVQLVPIRRSEGQVRRRGRAPAAEPPRRTRRVARRTSGPPGRRARSCSQRPSRVDRCSVPRCR